MTTLGAARIIRGDALALPIADNTVDLIVTSPPYFGLRSYTDGGVHYDGQLGSEPTPGEFLDALIAATREMVRVLKPSGSIWVNLGDKYDSGTTTARTNPGTIKDGTGQGYYLDSPRVSLGRPKTLLGIPWRYAIRCVDELELILRAEVIWSKPNGLPESVTDRVRRSHDTWFHFTVSPRYFSSIDKVREPYAPDTAARYRAGFKANVRVAAGAMRGSARGLLDHGGKYDTNPLGKLPGSVWTVPTQPLTVPPELGVDHYAAFPMEWPRRIIAGWSPARMGAVVLDPFGGTGTTALVAKALGRTGITVDKSADYCRLAAWRTTDPGQLAAALRVDKPAPIAPDQLALFDEVDA